MVVIYGSRCWHVFRQKAEYLFVIDGKLSPMMMNKRKWQDQQRNDDCMAENPEMRKVRACQITPFQSFADREIRVSDTGCWKCRNTSPQESRSREMRNAEIPNQAQ
jgi:hypothetical protein